MVATAIIGSAVVGAGASIAGAGAQSSAASSAAQAQTQAADQANAAQMQMFQQTSGQLSPFRDWGGNEMVAGATQADQGFNFDPTKANLMQTPGYQFNLNQGLKSTQNSMTARGLGNSGAALKGAAQYATGLADSTYQNQFNNALSSWGSTFNARNSMAQTGENAAAQTGVMGTQTASQMGQNTIGAGNAQAAADMASGNAQANALNSVGGNLSSALLMSQMMGGNGLFGGGGGGGTYLGTGGLY